MKNNFEQCSYSLGYNNAAVLPKLRNLNPQGATSNTKKVLGLCSFSRISDKYNP